MLPRRNQGLLVVFGIFLFTLGADAHAQATTVFRGRPAVKISEGGIERVPEVISRENAINLECVSSKIGDDYYWATRENVPMVAIESGAFITYVAANGAGYVKTIKPGMKKVAALLGQTEEKFDYTEHITAGLKTVTYSGRLRQ
jgi:hypothetical protein